MLTLKLAFRNMLAHGQRSFIMFLAVSLTSCFVFLFMAFSDGEIHNFRDMVSAVNNPPKDIAVTAKGYWVAADSGDEWKEVSRYSIADGAATMAELLAVPGIAQAAVDSRWLWLDMQAAGTRYRDFGVRRYDPRHAWQVRPYIELKSGDWIDAGAEPQIMMHYKAAQGMPIKPGDTVVLNGRDLFGQVVSQAVRVVGFFSPIQDNPNNTSMCYLNPAGYDLISGFNPGEALQINLKVSEGAAVPELIAALEKWNAANGSKLEFRDSSSFRRNDGGIYEMLRYIFQFVSLLIVFVVSFGVMSVVSTNLYDRKREIGTYYCLGSEKWFLIRLYTAEILMINLGATVAGILLGLGVRQIINALAIRTEDAGLQLVFGGSQFTLGLSTDSVLFILGLMLAVTLVTAVTTLGQRLKVSPVAALRETD